MKRPQNLLVPLLIIVLLSVPPIVVLRTRTIRRKRTGSIAAGLSPPDYNETVNLHEGLERESRIRPSNLHVGQHRIRRVPPATDYAECGFYTFLNPKEPKPQHRWLLPSSLRARYFFNDTNCSAVGGWTSSWEHSYPLYSTRCDIDRVNASLITRAEFDRYYRGKRPVIFVGGEIVDQGVHASDAGPKNFQGGGSYAAANTQLHNYHDYFRSLSRSSILRSIGRQRIVTARSGVRFLKEEDQRDKKSGKVAQGKTSEGKVAKGAVYKVADYIRKMDRPWLSSVVPPEDTDYVSGKTPFGEIDPLQQLAQSAPFPLTEKLMKHSLLGKPSSSPVSLAKPGAHAAASRAETNSNNTHAEAPFQRIAMRNERQGHAVEDRPYRLFFIGGVGSGAMWHVHPGAWSTTWYGLKRWFFRPGVPHPSSAFSTPEPTSAGYRGNTTIQWLFHEGPSGYANVRRHEDELVSKGIVEEPQFFECVSVPGETVYVPDMWWHATLNIGQMVSTTHIEILLE